MRANWRLRVTNPEHRGRLGRDALLLLEELVLTQPSTVTLSLRARAAIAINRPDILLESINGYAESVGAHGQLLRAGRSARSARHSRIAEQ